MIRNNFLVLGIVLLGSVSVVAQGMPEVVAPVSVIKTIDSEDPARFTNPSDPGIPVGDLNSDGLYDFIQVTLVFGDLRDGGTEDTYQTTILSYDDDANTVKAAVFPGLYFPLGDIDDDGIAELGRQNANGEYESVSFEESESDPVAKIADHMSEINPFAEADVEVIESEPGEQPNAGEGLAGDIDGDGVDDAVVCENEWDSYQTCILINGVPFTNEARTIVSQPFNFSELGANFSAPPTLLISESVAGEGNSLYAYGYVDDYTDDKLYEFDVDENGNVVIKWEVDYSNSAGENLSEARVYFADIDGDEKPELVSSDDRKFPISGFVQIHFQNPVCEFRDIDFSGEAPVLGEPTLISDNCVADRLVEDVIGNIWLGFWQDGNYKACKADDFENGCTSSEFINDDQTLQPCPFESCKQLDQPPGVWINGVADPAIQSRGLQFKNLDPNNGWVDIRRAVTFELLRIAEIYNAIALSAFTNGEYFDLIRSSFYSGKEKRDFECSEKVEACEFLPQDYKHYTFSVSETTGQSVRNTASAIRGGQYHHIQIAVDSEENEHAYLFISIGESFREPLDDYEFDPDDKIVSRPPLAEEDTVFSVGELDLSSLGVFDEGYSSFEIRNIGNIDGKPGEEFLLGSSSKTIGNNAVNKAWIYLGENTTYEEPDLEIDFNTDSLIDGFSYLTVGNIAEPLGDINGDGFNDFAVGLPFYDQRYDDVSYGAVFVFTGRDFSPAKALDTTSISEPFLVLRPTVEEGYTIGAFGSQVAGGDFDGDGYNDIAVLADYGSSYPASPTIRIFKGGEEMDNIPDYFLSVTDEDVGGELADTLSGTYDAIIAFMPEEAGADHQDLYYTPGGFSGYPDAVIFTGGTEPATSPSIRLAESGATPTGSGVYQRSKPAVGDFNGDGKYDIVVEKQYDGRDGAVSSRLLVFSPNSGIEVSNELELDNALDYRLSQNYPNPFNPSTNIEFKLGNQNIVTLKVFDVLGREVATLIDGKSFNSGAHTINFNAAGLASGVYIYRLEAGGFIQTRKMLLLK